MKAVTLNLHTGSLAVEDAGAREPFHHVLRIDLAEGPVDPALIRRITPLARSVVEGATIMADGAAHLNLAGDEALDALVRAVQKVA